MHKITKNIFSYNLAITSLVFTSGAFGQNNEAIPIHISLKDKASVVGARVYLSDISKCAGAPERCREITGIDVAASGAPGRSIFIQKAAVEAILEKEWPNTQITYGGSDAVRVEATGVEVSSDELRIKIQEFVSERTSSISGDIRVTVLRAQPLGFVSVRPTQSRLEFPDLETVLFDNVDWISKNLVGSRMVQVRVQNASDPQDRSFLQVQVTFSVDRQLPILKQATAAGQIIAAENLAMSWVAMRKGNQDFALSTDGVVGRKSRQAIGSGESIPLRYIESPLAVGRNQPVTMIVRSGGIEISARATTVDQGAIGQTVEVVNFATKKRMRARVIDEKTVEAVTF
jgi:flagellar basal body P-ring formation protein FlgA